MTVYGPATGNYSAASIRRARSANRASAGDQLIKQADGTYKYVDNTNGTNNYTNGSNSLQSYYSKMLQEQQNAQKAITQAAIAENNTYIDKASAASDKQLQEAYIANQRAKSAAPESLAALGITGGAAESSILGLDSNYQNTRQDINTERSNTLTDLYNNAAEIQATGDANLSSNAATYYQNLANAQAQALQDQQAQANWQAEFDASQEAAAEESTANNVSQYYTIMQQYNAGVITKSQANYMLGLLGMPTI